LLALGLDLGLGMLQASLARRERGRVFVCLGALAVMLIFSVLAPALASGPERAIAAARPSVSAGAASNPAPIGTLHVGAKTFTEQYVLARLIGARLEQAGLAVERHEGLGSSVAFDALRQGDIDVYVEYTGTIWSSYMRRDEPVSSWRMLALVGAWLADTHGIRLLGPLGFENAYCLAMRRDRAEALGIANLADLASRGAGLALGTDYEFPKRAERARLEATYPLSFGRVTSYDPSFMYTAVERGEVDVITAFSSDGRIDELNLVVLADPARAFPPYDAVLLLSPRAADTPAVVQALEPLVGTLSVERMRRANQMVDREGDKRTPEQAAGWLAGFSRER
jgi:osmoprotectant transport system permease protein